MLVPSALDCRVVFCCAMATELFGHSVTERGSLKRNWSENMQRMSPENNCDSLWCSGCGPRMFKAKPALVYMLH